MQLSPKKSQLRQFLCKLDYLALLLLSVLCVHGATESVSEWRIWTSTVGSKIEARLIEAKPNSIVLENRRGRRLTVSLSNLVKQDQAFVAAMTAQKVEAEVVEAEVVEAEVVEAEVVEAEVESPDAVGVISEPITCTNDSAWSYYLYLPKDFDDSREWPVWFIMSPHGAKFMNDMKRYIDGAEQLGCILAFSIESKNNFPDSELAAEAMINDVFDRLPVVRELAFTTGFSSGSRMAYLLAERDLRIAGVLACGSGYGVYPKNEKFRRAKLRKNIYVYSLVGTNCCNRTGVTKSHLEFPDEYRLRFFPGGHEWANSEYLSQGMARVLGAALERKRDSNYEKMRVDFARKMLDWAKRKQKTIPWEAYYWADYLMEFPSNDTIKKEASSLKNILASNPIVQSGREANRDILKFAEEHFTRGHKVNPIANSQRKKIAEKLAKKYDHLPHGVLFKHFGDPCSY